MLFLCRCVCFLLLFLPGCVEKESPKNEGKLKVLSTIAMIADLVEEIGGQEIESTTLIQGDLDPHTYELVKGDDEKFFRSDLIFYNGLGLEHGLSLRKVLMDEPKAISLGDQIMSKEPLLMHKIDGQTDPHIWMDISIWCRGVDWIVKALCEKDPSHANLYVERGAILTAKLMDADRLALERIQKIDPAKRYLITTHNAFNYFTRRYLADHSEQDGSWITRVSAPEGLAPDAQISLADIKTIIEYVQKYEVSVLFPESNLNRDALMKIVSASNEKGSQLRLSQNPIYGDAMGEGSYLNMMQHNVDVIARELEK